MRKVSMRDRSGRQVTEVGTPSDAPPADREASSARARIPEVVPARLLDRLLVAMLELPVLDGERAVVENAVDSIAAMVPSCAVGVCLIPPPSAHMPEQTIVKRLPDGLSETASGIDPTRVFPGLAHEYVAPIRDGASGSTLHVGSNDDNFDRDRSANVHLIDRAALVLGRALTNARGVAALRRNRHPGREFEQQMLQADKLANFGQIAAGVVHELNNPLTSIVAYSDYLIRKAASGPVETDADDLERLRRISQSATRMLRFTRDLVSYARPSSGVAGPVVLHDVIDQAIAFCEHVLSAAAVRVERRYGPDVLTVRAVGEQLVQVFVNLLTNASQAAPLRGGRVLVTTALAEPVGGSKRAAIFVEDNGSGIAPEHLPHVFAPFFTTKRDMQGTGLGLSIVRSILEGHDGAIRVESELGRGTRFAIELPVAGRHGG
jgi:two-component system NtrC family sensor kinase